MFADVPRESVQPSHETLLARAPDVILEVRATGLLGAAEVAEPRRVWAPLASIPAVRNGRIHLLTATTWWCRARASAQAAEALARALHPEAFRDHSRART